MYEMNAEKLIGNTPLVRLTKIEKNTLYKPSCTQKSKV